MSSATGTCAVSPACAQGRRGVGSEQHVPARRCHARLCRKCFKTWAGRRVSALHWPSAVYHSCRLVKGPPVIMQCAVRLSDALLEQGRHRSFVLACCFSAGTRSFCRIQQDL